MLFYNLDIHIMNTWHAFSGINNMIPIKHILYKGTFMNRWEKLLHYKLKVNNQLFNKKSTKTYYTIFKILTIQSLTNIVQKVNSSQTLLDHNTRQKVARNEDGSTHNNNVWNMSKKTKLRNHNLHTENCTRSIQEVSKPSFFLLKYLDFNRKTWDCMAIVLVKMRDFL